MKTIFLVLAFSTLLAVTLATDTNVKPSGDSGYDGSLKFELFGDGKFKGQLDALVKPFADILKSMGLNGEMKSEGDAKGGGHISGDFKFGGRRHGNTRSNVPNFGNYAPQPAIQPVAAVPMPM